MPVKAEEIATLIDLFNASDWDELHVAFDGVQLFLSTDPNARLATGAPADAPPAPPVPSRSDRAVSPPSPPKATTGDNSVPAHWIAVKAPNLGTFYRSPRPGAAPFVEVGQAVEAATELCLLEVMKLFTTVIAGTKGTIRRICVQDAEMVEHDQILFYIEP